MRYVRSLVLGLLPAIGCWLVLQYLVPELVLGNTVRISPRAVPPDLTDWLTGFKQVATIVMAVFAAGSVVWVLTGLRTRVEEKLPDMRWVWWLVGIISIGLGMGYGLWKTPPAWSGAWFPILCYVLSGALSYWLGTVVGSPPAVKYTPAFSMWLRR